MLTKRDAYAITAPSLPGFVFLGLEPRQKPLKKCVYALGPKASRTITIKSGAISLHWTGVSNAGELGRKDAGRQEPFSQGHGSSFLENQIPV